MKKFKLKGSQLKWCIYRNWVYKKLEPKKLFYPNRTKEFWDAYFACQRKDIAEMIKRHKKHGEKGYASWLCTDEADNRGNDKNEEM